MIIFDLLGLTAILTEFWNYFGVSVELGVGMTIFLFVWFSVLIENTFFYRRYQQLDAPHPLLQPPRRRPLPNPTNLVGQHTKRAFRANR